jgi:hypothetical protein
MFVLAMDRYRMLETPAGVTPLPQPPPLPAYAGIIAGAGLRGIKGGGRGALKCRVF